MTSGTWERMGRGVADTSAAMLDQGSGGEEKRVVAKKTVADIHHYCMGGTIISLVPDT